MTEPADDWLRDLTEEIRRASGAPAALADIFARLRDAVGADEAGRRWWAAFGAVDASET